MQNKKIMIAVPCMDSVPTVFCQSLATLKKVGDCVLAMQMSSLVYDSRDKLAKKAMQMGADYIFWLDSDMIFEPDTLERMLNTMEEKDLDFLSGVYYRRKEPYSPVLFENLEVDEYGVHVSEFSEIPNDLFECSGVGFGCVLMKADILFDLATRFQDFFYPVSRMGEDISFCWRARQCGYKLIVDPTIPLGHYSQTVVNKDFYEAFKGAKDGTN